MTTLSSVVVGVVGLIGCIAYLVIMFLALRVLWRVGP